MVIAILTVFIMLNVVLKLSFWKLWQQALFAAVCFLFVWLATDFASEQSQVTLQTMLSDPKVLGNITVLLTVETAVCMAYCFTSLRTLFKGKESRWHKVLQWYPNLLIFPALFYVLTQAIFYYTGVSFERGSFHYIRFFGSSKALTRERPALRITLFGEFAYHSLRTYRYC